MSERCCINVFDDGPLGVEELETLTGSNGEELDVKKRIALCRCGASENKPFCDGSHKKIGFTSKIEKVERDEDTNDDRREIRVFLNGPYEISGDIALNINDQQGNTKEDTYYLCRCGASENKPFCDGSHKKINFSQD